MPLEDKRRPDFILVVLNLRVAIILKTSWEEKVFEIAILIQHAQLF